MNQHDMQQELRALKQELHETRAQMAATVAHTPFKIKRSSLFASIKRKLYLLLTVVILAIGTYYGIQQLLYQKAVTEQASFVEQVKDLSQLATSQAYVKAVIEKEDNVLFGQEISADVPGTKRKLLLIVPGTVTAGVDLANLSSSNLAINQEEKTVELTLPHAQILQEPSLDLENAETFSVEGLFRSEVNWEEGYDLADEAAAQIVAEANAQGFLEKAESNATKTLTEFFASLGYDAVVTYE